MCPPTPSSGRFARETMIAAFHRMYAPLRRDRVDVVGAAHRGDPDLALAGPFQQLEHEVAGPAATRDVDHGVQRLEPLSGLVGVDVRQLAGQAVGDDAESLRG